MGSSKSEYALYVKALLVLIMVIAVVWVLFVMEVPCTVRLGFGIELQGHTTIWNMLTGQACRAG